MADKAEVTFGIRAKQLEPSTVTATLGLSPTHAFARGDSYNSKTTGPQTRKFGVWQLSSHAFAQSLSIQEHASAIANALSPLESRLEAYLKNDEYYMDVRFWLEVSGPVASFSLSASTLQMLSRVCKEFNYSIICGE